MDKQKSSGPVIALGNFDGVHLGHIKILKDALNFAKTKKLKAVAITFDPHPQEIVSPQRGLKLLTTIEERAELMCQYGIDTVAVVKFDRHMKNLTSEAFIKKIIVNKLHASHVFVGFDFAFGRKRTCGTKELKKFGKKYGFSVHIVPPVRVSGSIVKSSDIRKYASVGDFERALKFLGHPYLIHGSVVRGEGRGRVLGFPTANIIPSNHKLIPAHGVYAGKVYFDDRSKKCAVNIGSRPTFGRGRANVEIHIINFKGKLLGKDLKVSLIKRLRDEIQFSDVEELKRQIRKDVEKIEKMKL